MRRCLSPTSRHRCHLLTRGRAADRAARRVAAAASESMVGVHGSGAVVVQLPLTPLWCIYGCVVDTCVGVVDVVDVCHDSVDDVRRDNRASTAPPCGPTTWVGDRLLLTMNREIEIGHLVRCVGFSS